jgi:hypothetical protein
MQMQKHFGLFAGTAKHDIGSFRRMGEPAFLCRLTCLDGAAVTAIVKESG